MTDAEKLAALGRILREMGYVEIVPGGITGSVAGRTWVVIDGSGLMTPEDAAVLDEILSSV